MSLDFATSGALRGRPVHPRDSPHRRAPDSKNHDSHDQSRSNDSILPYPTLFSRSIACVRFIGESPELLLTPPRKLTLLDNIPNNIPVLIICLNAAKFLHEPLHIYSNKIRYKCKIMPNHLAKRFPCVEFSSFFGGRKGEIPSLSPRHKMFLMNQSLDQNDCSIVRRAI